ncbi:hypothetical protein F5887DRAFT_408251 [Amanita rubescens]|nr:hypothetical protein F5887DRAFT_408251 [Amanita rubescens]
MTAVLAASDPMARDRQLSLDSVQYDYSSGTDWRAKYNEVAEMLAETRAELDDFHHASKELEAELENELQRTEKAQQELKIKVSRTESERDDWKSKFLNLQTTHNTTTTSLQRELDKLRQEHQQIKVQLRELELGNDDLERNERAVSSSLADMEAKYSRALEEKILLEHELLEKAKLEEENQRLKDELRDANDEISILRDQAVSLNSAVSKASFHQPSGTFPQISQSSSEDLLRTSPPPDLQSSPANDSDPSLENTAKITSSGPGPTQSQSKIAPPIGRVRSTTAASLYSAIAIPKVSAPRLATRNISTTSTTSTTSTASKNKGVQMVSEMRARVKNLEQKLQTRVPRLRMGSITNRTHTNNSASTPMEGIPIRSPSSSSYTSSKVSTAKTSWESLIQRHSTESKQSFDDEAETSKRPLGDTSGWVLIMEESPVRVKNEEKERRRTSSPSAPSAYRGSSHDSSNLNETSVGRSATTSGVRRPSSRLSGSTLSTSSFLPTPTSRPATPSFLLSPSASSSSHHIGIGFRRSTNPNTPNPYSSKSSIPHSSDTLRSAIPSPSPNFAQLSSEDEKALPMLPAPNFAGRTSKLPTISASPSPSQGRIGRLNGRRSTGDPDLILKLQMEKRKRAGTTHASKTGPGL